jgi:hypothetical protein
MITSIDAEKALNKIQHPSMKKTSDETINRDWRCGLKCLLWKHEALSSNPTPTKKKLYKVEISNRGECTST